MSSTGRSWDGLVGAVLILQVAVCLAVDSVSYKLQEQQRVGSSVGNVRDDAKLAEEYSSSDLVKLRFSILPQEEDGRLLFSASFRIDDVSGALFVARAVDREALCDFASNCYRSFDVAVSPAQFFRVITVEIEILDINDNSPQFDVSTYRLNVSESSAIGSTFHLPAATDPDAGEFSVSSYAIIPASAQFDVTWTRDVTGATELRLVLQNLFDREMMSDIGVTVRAYDGGTPRRHADLHVDVSITDVNDNSPHFAAPAYEVLVSEGIPAPHSMLTVQADDPDEGANGQVQYALSAGTLSAYLDMFTVGEITGEITINSILDRETLDKYFLVVEAYDLARYPRLTSVTVTLVVDDVNDNSPQVKVNTLTANGKAQVAESTGLNTFVALVSISDKDEGLNGKVTCQLSSQDFSLIEIQSRKLKIITSTVLDRERKALYEVSIVCHDGGVPVLTSSDSLVIHVTDVNDHDPVFSQSVVRLNVSEAAAIGEYITRLNVTDEDIGENARVTFTFLDNVSQMLMVDTDSGVIQVNRGLDHERTHQLRLRVVAQDHGTPPRSSTSLVVVDIQDVNDEAPTFSKSSYTFVAAENQAAKAELGFLKAVDSDSEPFAEMEYSLYSDNGAVSTDFTVDAETGMVSTLRSFDRERQAFFYLTAIASNTAPAYFSASASLTVFIDDANDNAPFIDFPNRLNNTIAISNLLPPGTKVTQVLAHDLDSSENAELRYSLAVRYNKDPQLFGVDPATGELFLNRDLKQIQFERFDVNVSVTDRGSPPLAAWRNLTIIVNQSIAFLPVYDQHEGSDDSPANGTYIIIVIAMVAGSCVVIVILLIAIAVVMLKSRRKAQQDATGHQEGGYDGQGVMLPMATQDFPKPEVASQGRNPAAVCIANQYAKLDSVSEQQISRLHITRASGQSEQQVNIGGLASNKAKPPTSSAPTTRQVLIMAAQLGTSGTRAYRDSGVLYRSDEDLLCAGHHHGNKALNSLSVPPLMTGCDVDGDSASSAGDASNADSGRGSLEVADHQGGAACPGSLFYRGPALCVQQEGLSLNVASATGFPDSPVATPVCSCHCRECSELANEQGSRPGGLSPAKQLLFLPRSSFHLTPQPVTARAELQMNPASGTHAHSVNINRACPQGAVSAVVCGSEAGRCQCGDSLSDAHPSAPLQGPQDHHPGAPLQGQQDHHPGAPLQGPQDHHPGAPLQGPQDHHPGAPTQGIQTYPGALGQAPQTYPGAPAQGLQTYPGAPTQGIQTYPGTPVQGPQTYSGAPAEGPQTYPDAPAQAPQTYPGAPAQGLQTYPGAPAEGPQTYPGAPTQGPHKSSRQTMRNVKAKEKTKRQELPDPQQPANCPESLVTDVSHPTVTHTGDFRDSNSLLRYKTNPRSRTKRPCSSEYTDATSTTSGSYILQADELTD